jgi:hypothetical protein
MVDDGVDLDASRKEIEQLLVARLRPVAEADTSRSRRGSAQ